MLAFFMPIMAAIVRHVLTCVAGVLVAKGLISGDQVQPFVGSSIFMLGLAWSLWHKLNTPEVLAHLVARATKRTDTAKRAFAGATLGTALAIGAIATSAAQAQNFIFAPPPTPKIVHKVQMRPRALLPLPTLFPTPQANTPDALFAQLQQASMADLEYAAALANQAAQVTPPTAASTAAANRGKCYAAIAQVIATTSSVQAAMPAIGASAANPTAPTGVAVAFTKFEQLAQVADQLQPMSNVQTACAPVAQAVRMQVGQLVLAILGGGMSIAKLAIIP